MAICTIGIQRSGNMNSDILRGETVRLAALTREDASTISLWYDDTEFNRLFDSVPAYPKTESAVRESITERNKSSDAFVFSIRLIDTNELVGVIDLNGTEKAKYVTGQIISVDGGMAI